MEISEYMASLPQIGDTVNNCTAQTASLISQCDAYTGKIAFIFLLVGAAAGIVGATIGRYYRDRRK